MEFRCEVCGKKSTTSAGLALHMKVFHKEAKLPAKSVEKPKQPKKTKPKATATKKADADLIDPTKLAKQGSEAHKSVKKAFKQKPTGVEMGDTVKRAAIKKIFPSGMNSRLLKSSRATNVHKFLEPSYKAIVLINNNGWRRVRLVGETTLITWAEGPMDKGYKVTYPNLSKR